MTEKQNILKYISENQELNIQRNRMGCLESWYDPYFAMKETFTYDEIDNMTENEVSNLLKLAYNIQEALY